MRADVHQVQTGGDHLQHHQRQDHAADPAKTAERIGTAQNDRQHRQQQIRVAVAHARRVEARHHHQPGDHAQQAGEGVNGDSTRWVFTPLKWVALMLLPLM